MAKKENSTKVTRITASDSSAPKQSVAKTTPTTKKKTPVKTKAVKPERKKRSWGILGKIGGYFKGAWKELRQVHWPTRRATWGLTGAVLLFSAFFIVFITLLDAGFKLLFERILQ